MGSPNCTEMDEFKYTAASKLNGSTTASGVHVYTGGGYVLKVKGYITDFQDKMIALKKSNWIDNRTRAVIVEFTTYNAQVIYKAKII
jgi:hypothetical protein